MRRSARPPRRNPRDAAVVGSWLLGFVLLSLASCGGESSERTPASAPARDPVPSIAPTDIARSWQTVARTTLRAERPEYADERARAFRTLVDAGTDVPDLLRVVLQPHRPTWNGRALADLLSLDPDAVLPPLLRRITRSAPVARLEICKALTDPRADDAAASAVLAVRALLDPFDFVREGALRGLRDTDPAAAAAVDAHLRVCERLADGSVADLVASLLVGADRPFANPSRRRALLLALRAEGERFGVVTALRVAAFLDPLPEGRAWCDELLDPLLEYSVLEEQEIDRLVAIGPSLVPLLRQHLRRRGATSDVARALGGMGPAAADARPELLEVVRARRPSWPAAVVALARVLPGDAATADVLAGLLDDPLMTGPVAWALGEIGAGTPRVLEALEAQLVRSHEAGPSEVQSEGALMRLLHTGQGFDEVVALLHHERDDVARAALRVLAFCTVQDEERAQERIRQVLSSQGVRATRRAAQWALDLLSRPEEERLTAYGRRVAELTLPLEGR